MFKTLHCFISRIDFLASLYDYLFLSKFLAKLDICTYFLDKLVRDMNSICCWSSL